MKFKIKDPDLPEFIEYFVVEGASKLSSESGQTLEQLWPDMFNKDGKTKEWDLKVFLNGVLLPAEKVFEHMESQMNEMITRKAAELIGEKFMDIEDIIEDIKSYLLETMKAKFPDSDLDEEVTFE